MLIFLVVFSQPAYSGDASKTMLIEELQRQQIQIITDLRSVSQRLFLETITIARSGIRNNYTSRYLLGALTAAFFLGYTIGRR